MVRWETKLLHNQWTISHWKDRPIGAIYSVYTIVSSSLYACCVTQLGCRVAIWRGLLYENMSGRAGEKRVRFHHAHFCFCVLYWTQTEFTKNKNMGGLGMRLGLLLASKLHLCFYTDRTVQSYQQLHAYHAKVFHSLSVYQNMLWLSLVRMHDIAGIITNMI